MRPSDLPAELPAHVAEIVSEVLRLGPGSQVAYIEQVCGADPALRREVERALEELPEAELWGDGAPMTIRGNPTAAETLVQQVEVPSLGPGSRLSHYRIEERIGKGGMGEVFRARDLALDRDVAIKILRDLVDPSLRARLAREAHAGARVDHAAVATFIEFGRADGLDYLAMEYVDGETLRARLQRGPLEIDEAIGLAQTLLEALVFAHSLGILHRDIKPENIMLLPDGGVKLLDFGVAKDITLAEPAPTLHETAARTVLETMHGAVVGTPGYMAPEQVRGEPAVPASDLFALGAVLYEALSGRRAFEGDSARSLLLSVLSEDPPPLELGSVTADLQAILGRAMARDPVARYESARAFLTDLQQIAEGESVVHLPKSLAVLDFANLRQEPEHDWIGGGIAESLAVDLGRIEDLQIVPLARVRQVSDGAAKAGQATDPAELGLALRCRWVLAGTFQRAGEALRVTARLVEVATAKELWSEKIDGTLDTVLQVQDELAGRIAESLGVIVPTVSDARPRHERDAFECYQRAVQSWGKFERASVEEVMANMRRAIELEPDYAEALALMASAHAPSRWIQTTDPEDLERAIEFASRAIAADPELGSAHVWLGYAYWRKGMMAEAIESNHTAARLDPDSLANYFLGACYMEIGDLESALVCAQRYTERHAHPFGLYILGLIHMHMDHRAEARWALREAYLIELSPGVFHWQGSLAGLAEQKRREGDLEAARADAMEALSWVERSDSIFRPAVRMQSLMVLGRVCHDQGDDVAATAAFEQGLALAGTMTQGVGLGHLRTQLMAGLARQKHDRRLFDDAVALYERRGPMDFGFVGLGCDTVTCADLALAAGTIGDAEANERYRDRSIRLGMPEYVFRG